MTIDEIIKEVDSKSMGRTRWEGQEPRWDEAMVAEIRSLREAVRVLAEDVLDLNECFKRPYRGDETQIIEYINPKVLANPIAAAAVEAARNQAKGTQ